MHTLFDRDLLEWEAWAAPGRPGLPTPGVVVFRCVSDPRRRARVTEVSEGRAAAEALVQSGAKSELQALFERSRALG